MTVHCDLPSFPPEPRNKIFEVENSQEIMEFTAGPASMALWPLVRSLVLVRITTALRKVFDSYSPVEPLNRVRPNDKFRLNSLLDGLSIMSWPKDREILYISNKHANKMRDGKAFNHWEGPTAEHLGNKTLFISTHSLNHGLNRESGISFKSADLFYRIINKLPIYQKRTQRKKIADFIEYIKKKISNSFDKTISIQASERLEEILQLRLNVASLEYFLTKKILHKSKTKIIFIATCAYGNNIGIQRAATEMGLHTAEIQHGMIYKNHYAYNCSESIAKYPEARQYFPHHMLTYGSLWHSQITIPASCHVLGNPDFSFRTDQFSHTRNKSILFSLSDEYESFTNIIAEIIKEFPDREIVVRPHPSFIANFSSTSINQLTGFTLDTSSNLYETLEKSDIVIGSASTSLFEAAALGLRCFLKPSTVTEGNKLWSIFEHIESSRDLLSKLRTPDSGRIPDSVRNAVFASDWQDNYCTFIDTILQ